MFDYYAGIDPRLNGAQMLVLYKIHALQSSDTALTLVQAQLTALISRHTPLSYAALWTAFLKSDQANIAVHHSPNPPQASLPSRRSLFSYLASYAHCLGTNRKGAYLQCEPYGNCIILSVFLIFTAPCCLFLFLLFFPFPLFFFSS